MTGHERPPPRRHTPARVLLRLAVLFLASTAVAAAEAPVAPFEFTPPAFLDGPKVAKSLMGATYSYAARGPASATLLMITTIPGAVIRERFGALTDLQCIQLFQDEIKASHTRFFGVAMNRPLALGGTEFLRFRWNGDKSGRTMTGVLSCGELAGYYFVIHFVDELGAATRTFPAIRASLKTLAVRPR